MNTPTARLPLTSRQQFVLDTFKRIQSEQGIPPTICQVMAEIGITAPNGVICNYQALVRKGYLVHSHANQSHSYELAETLDERQQTQAMRQAIDRALAVAENAPSTPAMQKIIDILAEAAQ